MIIDFFLVELATGDKFLYLFKAFKPGFLGEIELLYIDFNEFIWNKYIYILQ